MSVFGNCDERILIEEIVEAECEEQEAEFCSGGEIDENSVTGSIVLAEVTDTQELLVSELIVDNNSSGESSGGGGGTLRDDNITTKNEIVRVLSDDNEITIGVNCRLSRQNGGVGRVTPRSHMEQEKRMRREIANSNERRRMQSINAGFQSLRTLLPHHEGEKLSKAAILQQTAEYIYQLEQEKTQLLSQNCQLKRLVNQHEGGDVPIKKRKAETQGVVVSLPMHVNESGDEGLGSMSPEPMSVITVTTEGHAVISNNNGTSISDVAELRRQLERERQQRLLVEKQMRAIQTQLYPERFRDNQLIAYQPHEVIEHTDNVMAQETEEAVAALQVVSVVSLPPVGSTQTVETSNPDPCSPPLSPETEEIIGDDLKEEDNITEPESPKIVAFATSQVFANTIEEQTSNVGSFSPSGVTYGTSAATNDFKGDFKNTTSTTLFIKASPTRPFSPPAEPQRLPSVLEAAIKAEPKVEVERLPSPANSLDDGTPQARLYLANTSRQNLETIVEAIRHLEGDHLFSDEPAQDVPLALTNKQTILVNATSTKTSTSSSPASTINGTATVATKQRLLHAEVNNFLQFHTPQSNQQQRPGVIVVKHS